MLVLSPFLVSKIFIIWIFIISIVLYCLLINTDDDKKKFYRFGWHEDLWILGIQINTFWKWFGVVGYSFINSMFRTVYHNYLNPWIINNIQDEVRSKKHLLKWNVYEVTSVSVVYNWTDWLLYMNILLAQVDMMIVEVLADLLMSLLTTYYYLGKEVTEERQTMHTKDTTPLLM